MMSQAASAGSLARAPIQFTGVKVFSATMFGDRAELGEKVTDWIARNQNVELSDISVTQSSDASFHCITITLFYKNR